MERPHVVLALGAHPDDIELGCGATLAKLSAAGWQVHALIMSEGAQGAPDHKQRTQESREALGSLGVRSVVQHDFADTRLHEHLNEMIAVIGDIVAELRPSRVYTMFDGDRHQDHRAVYQASAVACRSVPELLGYETPSSYPNFIPTVFETIEDHLAAKLAAIRTHRSQQGRLYMQDEKVSAAAHFRGVQVNVGPSEGFIPYKLVF